MGKIILINYQNCVGCRTCEMVCSLSHYKEINPVCSRIKVAKWEDAGHAIPINCRQCEDAPCVEICPQKAISRDQELARTVINYERCIGCRSCVVVCPFGAMAFHAMQKKMIKCDLCDGDPLCVKFCAYETLKYIEPDELNKDKLTEFAESILKSSF